MLTTSSAPRTGRIAIVGLAPSHEDAPWADPQWEKWGLAWDEMHFAADRLFEMHDMAGIEAGTASGAYPALYRRRLEAGFDVPLYMREEYYPHATEYPLEEVIADVGDYFQSSIAYMLALAIHEKAEEIGLWGVGGDDIEYQHQRPNHEWLLGLAQGRGIRVTLPDDCPLLKYRRHDVESGEVRYGDSHSGSGSQQEIRAMGRSRLGKVVSELGQTPGEGVPPLSDARP